MDNLLKPHQEFCPMCGVPNSRYATEQLYDIYYRIRDGRSTWQPLVYTMEEFNEHWDDLHEENYALLAMENNMHERGLCTTCGRPNLRGVKEEDIMTPDEAKEIHDMWAMEAAERRAGC